jgi:hypothetical protein
MTIIATALALAVSPPSGRSMKASFGVGAVVLHSCRVGVTEQVQLTCTGKSPGRSSPSATFHDRPGVRVVEVDF